MPALSPDRLLDVWARARREQPARRAVALLEAAHPAEGLDALPIGTRDRMLLALFEENFGRGLNGTGICRGCEATIELALDVQALSSGPAADDAPAIVMDGVAVALRLPSTADILAAAAAADPSRRLAALCLGHGAEEELDDEAVRRIGEALLGADPLLDLEIGVVCPECGAEQAFGLDVAAFLWERVEARALRLMGEVDRLARAYGWSEQQILALPAARRAAYLAMVTA